MEAPNFRTSLRNTSSTEEYDSNSLTSASLVSNTALDERRAEILKRFSTLLGTKSAAKEPSNGVHELVGLLASSVDDGDVVLTLPALDLRLSEGDASVLPGVGEHSKMDTEQSSRPSMGASVLTMAAEGKANIEQKAAQNIGKETSWTKSTLRYASGAVGTNVSESFTSLVNARVKAWTLLLLRHSLSTGDNESRSRLLNMLSAKIRADSAESTFKTLPLPPSAAGKPKDSDVILPLLFEVHVQVTIQDKAETVVIRAPGTVSAIFAGNNSDGLKKVIVRLDTNVVLNSLVDQARIVVLKAVASATKTPVQPTGPPGQTPPGILPQKISTSQQPQPIQEEQAQNDQTGNSSGLSSFRSALSLSPADAEQSPRLQKARSSALKLNSVLHGKAQSSADISGGLRKVRSVKWDTPVQAPKLGSALAPNPKKLRLVQTAAKLKSFKSFGRPHGGDFGSGPRNATFGAFGTMGSEGLWGRNGRLAHVPRPMQQNVAQSDEIGMTGLADRNATFDLNKSKQNAAASAFSSLLRSKQFGNTRAGFTPAPAPGLTRTTTAMESSLMKTMESSLQKKYGN